jgi:muramoyltetrapeptide carboxypeptidase LdcA involved in peptidoglycan recycling
MKPDWKSEILFCEDDSETLKPIQRLLRQITDPQASDSTD